MVHADNSHPAIINMNWSSPSPVPLHLLPSCEGATFSESLAKYEFRISQMKIALDCCKGLSWYYVALFVFWLLVLVEWLRMEFTAPKVAGSSAGSQSRKTKCHKRSFVIVSECSTSTAQWSGPQGHWLRKYRKRVPYRPWHIISSTQNDAYSAPFPSEGTQAVLMNLLHRLRPFCFIPCPLLSLLLSLSLSLSFIDCLSLDEVRLSASCITAGGDAAA